ncbi:MAG: PilZ domain-containing protein [Terriglobales bacterium]
MGCSLGVMSNTGSGPENESADAVAGKETVPVREAAAAETPVKKGGRFSEMQSAPRFPIKLPISVKSKSGESRQAETQNISANGVLFQVVDAEMPVGSTVDFTISLPAEIVGAEADVRLDCKGRVVRNFEESGRHGVGVVIDEYRFDRH